ncbi:glycoside hydrolase family 88 protein [Meredithblackwellia eburnea MCA 4105]
MHRSASRLRIACSLGIAISTGLVQAASVPQELFSSSLYTKYETTSSGGASAWPEYTGTSGWVTFPATEWTAAFLSSSLYLLHERHTALCPSNTPTSTNGSTVDWLSLARTWSAGLYTPDEAITDTHDVGFLSWPAQFELGLDSANATASAAVLAFAGHLANRFSTVVGCTKSWDNGGSSDFQVIIDNMMNLQLLTYASVKFNNATLLDMATSHANKTLTNQVRSDFTSYHVVDYDPTTGGVQWRGTAQGYSNSSTWSRGQSWGAYGYALMYNATNIQQYLDTSRSMSQWYLDNLPTGGVPYWDFEAPQPATLDSSSATIMASGLLFLSEIETRRSNTSGATHWSDAAINLLGNTVTQALDGWTGVSVLGNGTVNNRATPPNNNTGIIYGDHFFVEAGNRLLKLGLANCTDGSPAVGALKSSSSSGSSTSPSKSSSASGASSTGKTSAANRLRPLGLFLWR